MPNFIVTVDTTSPDELSGVESMLAKVMADLQEHEEARQVAENRILELEAENTRLQAKLQKQKTHKANGKAPKRRRRKRKTNAKTNSIIDTRDLDQLNEVGKLLWRW